MAVWLYAYGHNKLQITQKEEILSLLNQIELNEPQIFNCLIDLNCNEASIKKYFSDHKGALEYPIKLMEDSVYSAHLNSMNLPNIDRDQYIEYLYNQRLKKAKELRNQFKTLQEQFLNKKLHSSWEYDEKKFFSNNLGQLGSLQGFQLWLLNDLVGISGPFDVFSYYGTFQKAISKVDRENFNTLFKNIAKAFGSKFILYTHEWSGMDDEEDKTFNLTKLKKQSNWKKTSSNSIHTMSDFYYEKLAST